MTDRAPERWKYVPEAITEEMIEEVVEFCETVEKSNDEYLTVEARWAASVFRSLLSLIERLTRELAEARAAAIEEISTERKRQIETEGWTAEHDDEHTHAEMARAAVCYIMGRTRFGDAYGPEELWPLEWDYSWWKPGTYRRNLVKAGALIVAEIERLDRRASRNPDGESA